MIRGVWDREAVGLLLAASLLPVATAALFEFGAATVPVLALSGGAILAWQALFRGTLGVPYAPAGAVTAVAAAILAPGEAALWQVLLAVSFGTVIGELVFGGWGRSFLNPALAALAFLYLSVPNAVPGDAGTLVALAVALSALMLLLTGILSWVVVIAAAGAFAATATALGTADAGLAALGTHAFVLVYLVGDPVAAAATRPGRWIYGALAGGLAALLATGAGSAAQAAVFAALLAQIFAPLIDQGVIAAQMHRRRHRHG